MASLNQFEAEVNDFDDDDDDDDDTPSGPSVLERIREQEAEDARSERLEGFELPGGEFVTPTQLRLHELSKRAPTPVRCLFAGTIPFSTISGFYAPGDSWKSRTAHLLHASIGCGRNLLPSFRLETEGEPGRSWFFTPEDTREVIEQSFAGIRERYQMNNFEYRSMAMRTRIYADNFGPLVTRDGEATDFYHWLKAQIEEFGPLLITLDPLIDFVRISAQDADGANWAYKLLLDLVRGRDTALLLVDHSTKGGAGSADATGMAGSPAKSNAIRSLFSFAEVGAKEARALGIQLPSRKMMHAKHNWLPAHPPIYLNNIGGVVVETSVDAAVERELSDGLRRVAVRLAELLDADAESFSVRDVLREASGANIRAELKTEFKVLANRDNLEMAVDFGITNSILTTEIIASGGAPKTVLRACRKVLPAKPAKPDMPVMPESVNL